jgi:hypothetical protein
MKPKPWKERVETVRERRRESIFRLWAYMVEDFDSQALDTRICRTRVCELVEHYLIDAGNLITRDNISGSIQHHKAAGLIAASIIKYQPIVPKLDTEPIPRPFFDNEIVALVHGLSISFQEDPDALERFEASPGYAGWFKRTIYFMKWASPSSDALIAVFDTVVSLFIPAEKRSASAGSAS